MVSLHWGANHIDSAFVDRSKITEHASVVAFIK
jgi:hypothetical protein